VIQRLRARWVLPITAEPIEDGEVVVVDGRIAEARPRPLDGRPAADCTDLGDAVLLPGLVNVHAHLDYTVMRGLLDDLAFFPWIRALTLRRQALDHDDWVASATVGAAEAVAGGVTTLADCTSTGASLIGARAAGLRGIIFQEAFAVESSQDTHAVLAGARGQVEQLREQAAGSLLRVGLSPHSPYTVHPDALRALCDWARAEGLPVCIHAAESQPEAALLHACRGGIAERLTARGVAWHRHVPSVSAVAHLESLGALGPSTLLVHGVQVSAADRALIARTGTAWAHCPKSNAKLGNGVAPLNVLRQSYPLGRDRIGLGSDSVASNNTMDLFEEMRFAVLIQRARSARHDAFTAREALEMATLGGARALGMEAEIGSLEPGKQADLCAVHVGGWRTAPCHHPVSALVYAASARDVALTMVAGEPVFQDGRVVRMEHGRARDRIARAAEKLRAWTPPE